MRLSAELLAWVVAPLPSVVGSTRRTSSPSGLRPLAFGLAAFSCIAT